MQPTNLQDSLKRILISLVNKEQTTNPYSTTITAFPDAEWNPNYRVFEPEKPRPAVVIKPIKESIPPRDLEKEFAAMELV